MGAIFFTLVPRWFFLRFNDYFCKHSLVLFVLFGISIFSASASAMKLYVGVYVHWILVLSVVAALFLMLLMKKGASDVVQVVILAFRSSWRYFIFWILLVFSIVISSALNDWAGVYSAVKYIALAAVLLALLVFTPSSDLLLRIMMFVAVTALAAFLVVVIFLPEYMDRSIGRPGRVDMDACWRYVEGWCLPVASFILALVGERYNVSYIAEFFCLCLPSCY